MTIPSIPAPSVTSSSHPFVPVDPVNPVLPTPGAWPVVMVAAVAVTRAVGAFIRE